MEIIFFFAVAYITYKVGTAFVDWLTPKAAAETKAKKQAKKEYRQQARQQRKWERDQAYIAQKYRTPVYQPQYQEPVYQEPVYQERYEPRRSAEETCPYNCRYGVRDCPMCKGHGAGMFDSYDVCPGCNDSGDVMCDHR